MSIAIERRTDVRLDQVHHAIRAYCAERTHSASRYGPEFTELWRIATETVLGGKLVRPRLVLAVHAALTEADGPAPQTVVNAAAAVELLHYAFVLHDDVIDGDLIRRGRPNLIGTVANSAPTSGDVALHWATTSGILMGDLMLSGVYQLIAELDAPASVRSRLTRVLGEAIDETVAGEHADVGLSHGVIAPDLGTILAMSANKTATYTFCLPLAFGAILADADAATVRALTRAGRHLGSAFQLQDDLLSVFGDPAWHGKDAASDLREGKMTAIIAHARGTRQWRHIEPFLGRRNLTAPEVARVCGLLESCGARASAERLIGESMDAFRAAIADPAVPARAREDLGALAASLRGRAA
ncbi:MAG: polyprenyl synthetase family protein [Demequina sp.]|jgi:geranylgeranyl diphosphate synthase type II|nr:polyprenyl synthetase family protein [Demequina sp.]